MATAVLHGTITMSACRTKIGDFKYS